MRAINLMPPEARQRARARRRRAAMVGLAVVYLVVLALVALYWRTKVSDAQRDLEAQQAVNAQLQAEIAQLESARALEEEYDQGVAMLETILTLDVAWGRILNDLGRVIPDRVWLETFAGQVQVPEEEPAPAAPATTTTTVAGAPPTTGTTVVAQPAPAPEAEAPAVVGQISAAGTAFGYPDVASWLRTIDSDQFPALGGAWVSAATLGEIGEAEVVEFDSVAALTREALSDRFEERLPEVPE